MRMTSSRLNLGKYRSITADERAGTELAPLITVTPARLRERAEDANAGYELAAVRQVDVMTPRFDCGARHGVLLALERPCRVNQEVDAQTSKNSGQMAVVSIKRHRVFNWQAHGARSGARPLEIPAAYQHSQGRARSKCRGNALTKESIATQHEDRAHQIPPPAGPLNDRSFPG